MSKGRLFHELFQSFTDVPKGHEARLFLRIEIICRGYGWILSVQKIFYFRIVRPTLKTAPSRSENFQIFWIRACKGLSVYGKWQIILRCVPNGSLQCIFSRQVFACLLRRIVVHCSQIDCLRVFSSNDLCQRQEIDLQ